MKPHVFLIAAVAAVSCGASEVPSWWTAQGTSIGVPSGQDYAIINVGQLKNVAVKAKAYLDSQASNEPLDWYSAYDGSGAVNPFSTSAFYGSSSPDHAKAANVGQLKFLAYGFYKILHERGYPVTQTLVYHGFPADKIGTVNGIPVPWDTSASPGENEGVVTVGQLKMVFSFMLAGVDNWGTGYTDLFEVTDDDNDGDLMSTYVEYLTGNLDSSFQPPASIGHGDPLGLSGAFPSGNAPLIVLPGKGIYTVNKPSLSLNGL